MEKTITVNGKDFTITPDKGEVLETLSSVYPNQTAFTRAEIKEALDGYLPYWIKSSRFPFKEPNPEGGVIFNLEQVLSGYNGGFSHGGETPVKVVPVAAKAVPSNMPVAAATESVNLLDDGVKIIPEKMTNYVPFGDFKDVKGIVKSKIFFPTFITGLSGNGKTLMVEQVCAQLKRELFRVNITEETDEDDLMGGHTLVNGNIVFREGPVIKAMRKGAVLLLDEIDLGSSKLMCLQSVLEGKGYLIKKTGEWVSPKEGFTIFATANTKGQGSEDGKFIGTRVMNEAMLERFTITITQEYPPVKTERSILKKEMATIGIKDDEFAEKLVDWADIIRKTFYEGGIDDVITTRRLVHIVNAYKIFNDKLKSITKCISRFDEETRNSILDLYTKVDEGVHLDDEKSLDEASDSDIIDENEEDYDY